MSCKFRKIKLDIHVNLKAYKLHSMQSNFIKVVLSGDWNLFLEAVGSNNNNFSCPSLMFLMFLHKRFTCQDFMPHFLLNAAILVMSGRNCKISVYFNHRETTPIVRTQQTNTWSESTMRAQQWSLQLTIKTK